MSVEPETGNYDKGLPRDVTASRRLLIGVRDAKNDEQSVYGKFIICQHMAAKVCDSKLSCFSMTLNSIPRTRWQKAELCM